MPDGGCGTGSEALGGLGRLKRWARAVKQDALALYLAARDPRTPWHAKLLAGIVVAYALSPIDLIPDFIPVLGYLDDLLLVPLGLWLAVRLIPEDVMEDCRARGAALAERPVSRTAAVVVVVIWLAALAVAGRLVWSLFGAG
jgi:uncharacterized membrane protein YkvA (DUF1232 family)